MSLFLAILPIAVLVVALTVVKAPAWCAALAAFATGAIEAFFAFGLTMPEIAKFTANGAATGLFPIGLVIVSALFTYGITVE